MPTITAIKSQKRTERRYSIYLDGKYAFALSDLDLSTSGLRVGQPLTQSEVEQYNQEAEQSKLYALALRFLSFRSRSRQEMTDHLRRKGYEPEQIERAIRRLVEGRLLNDQEFAASWITTRMSLRPRSRRRLEQELRAKGIAADDIAAALSELEPDDELSTLVEIIERKQRLPQYQAPEKLMGYLARQGYSYELIKKALARLDED